jgi:hypothetical protein
VLMAPWTVQGLLEGHHSCSDHIAPLSGRLQPRTTLLGLFGLFWITSSESTTHSTTTDLTLIPA